MEALNAGRVTVARRTAVLAGTAGALVAVGGAPVEEPADDVPAEQSAPPAEVSVANAAYIAVDAEQGAAAAAVFEVAAEQAERPEPAGSASPEAVDAEAGSTATGDASELISIAKQYLGVPYVWGGTSPSGFDCSGFTSYVYQQVGVNLPRTSSAQLNAGSRVSAAEAKPGDLVGRPGHVGIYLGDGKKIHSPHTGSVVKIDDLSRSDTTFVRVL
ncbi:C40 family peptidase [Sediminivirga luteola]|uniref:C40 family peptidase n=1 Tax=Sediminivirga luteola TaxID=1774748 RepID=UPI001E5551F8|nr:C40 family peptidase [Sediminivirga luteola]MCI2265939.1 NlpC/P60 family protein [Sediminivirga luteola]